MSHTCLNLPYPPTVNTYWRRVGGRTIISAAGRRYRKVVKDTIAVYRLCGVPGVTTFGRAHLAIEIEVFPPDNQRRDLDNILKALIDSLEHAGLFEDDSQIEKITIWRREVEPEGAVKVSIMTLPMHE